MLYIFIGLGTVVLLFLFIAALQPTAFRITRTGTISAPPSAIFEKVNDLHEFQTWSPWAKIDSNLKLTFEGPSTAGRVTAKSEPGA